MEKEKITPETVSSLAKKYGISWMTMKIWLRKIGKEHPENGGALFTPDEVKYIKSKIGCYQHE